MSQSGITELAVRAAANQFLSNDMTDGNDLKKIAQDKAKSMALANSKSSQSQTAVDFQGAAINIAIKGVLLAVSAVSSGIADLRSKRVSFDQERKAGVSTFVIPLNKEQKTLSQQEIVIQEYLSLINKDDTKVPLRYFGIKSSKLDDILVNYHSVLPFYRMSNNIAQPVADKNKLEQQRVRIRRFFKTGLIDYTDNIEHEFNDRNIIIEFAEAVWQGKNYLNNLRAPRFIIMSLANLLWNLQGPVDAEGFPLSYKERIDLCTNVEGFLSNLIRKNVPPNLNLIHNEKIELSYFVQRVETHVSALKDAFIDKNTNSFDFQEVTNSARRSLQIMNKSIWQFISSKGNDADKITDSIGYMQQLLERSFHEVQKTFSILANKMDLNDKYGLVKLNTPPATVIDILIIFCHTTPKKKKILIDDLKQSDFNSLKLLAIELQNFDNGFIQPNYEKIMKAKKTSLKSKLFNKNKNKIVAKETARHLIPLFCLTLADSHLNVDSSNSNLEFNGLRQVMHINQQANEGGDYYEWSLSIFRENNITVKGLNKLPEKQFRLTKVSYLLDSLQDIIHHYKSFLSQPNFKTFLLDCIEKVNSEYMNLDTFIKGISENLNHDSSEQRELEAILKPMLGNISQTSKDFNVASTLLNEKLNSPTFSLEQKQILKAKVSHLDKQYKELFGQRTGIKKMMTKSNSGFNARSDVRYNLTYHHSQDSSDSDDSSDTDTDTYSDDRYSARTNVRTNARTNVRTNARNNARNNARTNVRSSDQLPYNSSDSDEPTKARSNTRLKLTYNSSGSDALSNPNYSSNSDSDSESESMLLVLRQLAEHCQNSMSYYLRDGNKAYLLQRVLEKLTDQNRLSNRELRPLALDLVRITMAYRDSYFFQADYGSTRSAKALAQEIKNLESDDLPKLLFGDNHQVDLTSSNNILANMRLLSTDKDWSQTADNLRPVSGDVNEQLSSNTKVFR